jgi:UDP-GlcNAc:undecaprenyl-phosphate GlcNAc-1-phosphate transferase
MLEFLAAVTANNDRWMNGFRAPMFTAGIALFISYLLTPWVRNLAIKRGAVDDPKIDDRRVHKEPTPRWGGIAIFAGIAISILVILPFAYPTTVAFPWYLIGMLGISAMLVVVGALDDLYQYKAKLQALFLLLAGVLVQFIFEGDARVQVQTLGIPLTHSYISLGIFAVPLTAIYIFVVTKTMDTIDGVDGLAAGIASISAGTLMLIGAYSGQPRVAIIAGAIGGAALGFLRHNYNPAKIFMGTGGAYVLGFMLATLSIVGALKTAAAVSLIIPVLVFGVPIVDAINVIIRRLLSGQPITQADKRHLHHQLLGKGLSQKQTVWVLYFAAAALCAVAIFVVRGMGQAGP